MLFGLLTGLARIGFLLPSAIAGAAELHAAFMISGFLGTLISLERAVALGRWWAYMAPIASAAGVIALLIATASQAALLFLSASLILLVGTLTVLVRQRALFVVLLAVAAACWGVGTLDWLSGGASPDVAGWWLNFLVLTVAAERLELSRLLKPPRVHSVVVALSASALVVGASRHELSVGVALCSGFGLLVLTVWLVRYDVALRTIRQSGQPRFSATCMLAGYGWLAVAATLLLTAPPSINAFSYDAAIHAITIGFVFSMIFGHAPIILPAVIGIRIRYTSLAFVPLALLHLSVVMRIAGDVGELLTLRRLSGLAAILAVAAYATCLLLAPVKATIPLREDHG
jgi:hypothetical protein